MLNLWYCDYVSVQRGDFNPCKHTSSKWASPPTTSCCGWCCASINAGWLTSGPEQGRGSREWEKHENDSMKSTDSLCSGHLVVFNTWFHFRSLYINFTLLCRSVHRCDQMCHIFVTPPPSGYRCSLQVDGLTASGPPLMNRFPFTYSPEFLAFFVSAVSFTHFSNYLTPPLLLLLLFIPFPPPLSTSLRVSLLSSPFLSSSISFITSFSLLVSFGSPRHSCSGLEVNMNNV